MPGPASDMRGNTSAMKTIKGTIPLEMKNACLAMMKSGKAENQAHALRVLVTNGLIILDAGNAPKAEEIASSLATMNSGSTKELKVTADMHDKIAKYKIANSGQVDGVAGAMKHIAWIGMQSGTKNSK